MSDAVNPYQQMADMWKRYLDALQPGVSGQDGSVMAAADLPRQMMERMADANVAVVTSGFRVMQRWAELSGRAYPLAAQAMSLVPTGGMGMEPLLDELREIYREMGELGMKESRRLQDELAGIWMPAGAEEPAEEDAPRRRRRLARAKD